VSYNNPASLNGVFWYAWRTMLVVFLVLVGAPVLCWRLLLYVRKAANRSMDVELLVYFVLAAADTLSATLCIVLFLVRGKGGHEGVRVTVCRPLGTDGSLVPHSWCCASCCIVQHKPDRQGPLWGDLGPQGCLQPVSW
jgi:hypothetical protein